MNEGWEILTDWPLLKPKATWLLQALVQHAPAGSVSSAQYRGDRRFLMLYGPGAPSRLPIVQRHVARGGHVAMWDLGYFDRPDGMRVSIDALHPHPQHIAMSPAIGRRQFELREDADPAGPILLIGLGKKSVAACGIRKVLWWEHGKVGELQARFPGREILWRPKGKSAQPLLGLRLAHGMPIEEALRGCSLVVCRHSNVAVDACIAGVPVECEDGAALALYRDNPSPTREQRLDFLHRLTWWNWTRNETPGAWQWLEQAMASIGRKPELPCA